MLLLLLLDERMCIAARVQWYVAAGDWPNTEGVPKGRSQFLDRNGHFNHTLGGFPGVKKGRYSAEISVVSARERRLGPLVLPSLPLSLLLAVGDSFTQCIVW